MVKYFLTNKAVEDLSEIWNYTFDTWSEQQADKYYEALIKASQQICDNPNIGKIYEEIANDILGFRVEKHIIFYRIVKTKEIQIVRILHGSMDLKTKMKD